MRLYEVAKTRLCMGIGDPEAGWTVVVYAPSEGAVKAAVERAGECLVSVEEVSPLTVEEFENFVRDWRRRNP